MLTGLSRPYLNTSPPVAAIELAGVVVFIFQLFSTEAPKEGS